MRLAGRHRFAQALPTFLENWPAALQALSFPQQILPLSLADATALGASIRHFGHWFGDGSAPSLTNLADRLELATRRYPAGAFVRLGSCSAKDCDLARACGQRVTSARDSLRLLTDGSRRVASDLRQCIARGYAPHIVVREWQCIPAWAELRCFMHHRQLVGACQYDCINIGVAPQLLALADCLLPALQRFFAHFVQAVHLDDVVFDLAVQPPGGPNDGLPGLRLIELNPFGPQTDAVLFNWHANGGKGDFDGSCRLLR